MHPFIVGYFQNQATGYFIAGLIWGILSVLPIFWCVWGTWEKYHLETIEIPIIAQLKIAFTNKPYLYVIGIYLCSWLAFQNTATIIPYYVTYWMKLKTEFVGFTILAVQGTALVMLFVWAKVSAKIGKKAVYVIGMSVWIFAQTGLYFLQPNQVALMFVLAMLAGVGVSTAYMIPWSMIADVIELDELKTGQRREGVFYGFMVLLQKVGLAIALLGVGVALDRSGFVKPEHGQLVLQQPDLVLQTLRIMIAPLPALCLILGIAFAALYPITREVHAEILFRINEKIKGNL